jgi:uracil-DNA glycosylase
VRLNNTHGQVTTQQWPGRPPIMYVALYHPAAALYDNSLRDIMFNDITKVRELLDHNDINNKNKGVI